jgi:hypothetical protein
MANLSPPPKLQFFDANGVPLVGGKLYSYAAGTTTPLATYTSSAETTFNTNPILLNSRGEAEVWLGTPQYKFKLTTAADVEIWTVDNITSWSGLEASIKSYFAASAGSSRVGFIQAGVGAVARTAQDKMRDTVSVVDYGAVGDGIANDTAAIQAAINAANGRAIWFKPGATYNVGPTNLNLLSNTSLVSDGSATIKLTAIHTLDLFRGASISNVIFDGLIIDGSSISIGANFGLIGFFQSSNIVIRNCRLINIDRFGLAFNACSGFRVYDNYIARAAKAATQNQAILVSTASGASSDNFIERNICENSAINVSMSRSFIRGNIVNGFGFGAGITTEQDPACNLLTIDGNFVTGGTGTDVNVYNCGGIENWAAFSTIQNNVVWGNAGAGIDQGGKDNTVKGNLVYNNGVIGGPGISGRYGTATYNSSGSVYSGNRAFDTGGAGGTQTYGYQEESSSLTYIVLSGNHFNGNKTAPALILSSSTAYSGPQWSVSETYDPPNIGALGFAQFDVTAPGARLGDLVQVSFSLDVQSLVFSGAVSGTNAIRVTVFNPTGSAVNLASGTLMVTYEKTKSAANV